jgi:hypothetical protein
VDGQVSERYGAMLEQYLRNVGDYKLVLGHQMFVMSKLEQIAYKVCVHSGLTWRSFARCARCVVAVWCGVVRCCAVRCGVVRCVACGGDPA